MFAAIKWWPFFLLLLFGLAGCTTIDSTALVNVIRAPESPAAATCPMPTADAQLLRHDVQGYCLLYPTGYEVVEQAVDYAITVLAPPSTMGHRERLFINVEEAKGRSAEEAAMELLAAYTLPAGTDITTVEFLPNQQPVYILDPLPGQDLSRHAFFVQDDRLFHLLFVPSDPDQDEAYQQMELLYTTVVASFTFIPPSQDAAAPGLVWEGYTPWGDGDDSDCKSLRLFRDDQALIGPCDAPDTPVQINRGHEWAEMLNLFAPFQMESKDGQLVFYGSGERDGEAWQRAIDAWARYTYAELATGSVTASGRTALSWWLGELPDQPGTCGHLLVLVHGYAQISIEPCGGGEALARAESWLQTDEWERFDAWLYNRAPVAQEADYFSGLGTEEMSPTERAALAQWAAAVYDRIANATPSYLGQDAIETDQPIGSIVFASRQSGDMDIYIMQPDGSNPLRLSQDETWDGFPTPSSDGQRIAFVAETLDSQRTPLKSDIYVVNSDGSGLTDLTDHSAFDTQPSWSPDGAHLAFVSTRNGDGTTPSLYRMDADGSQLHLLVENAEQPAWSPTGEQIAFVQDGQIHLLQLADQTTVQLTTDAAPSPQAVANSNPLWSPDGSQIAFTSNRDGNGEIYVMNADGSAQINLSRLPGYQNSPVWSPDGSQIAFASDDSDQPGIYIIQADGSDLVKVTRAATPEFLPTWSPDGRWLAFVSDPVEQVIARANLDEVQQGDGVFPHLLTPAQNTFPVWIR